MKCHWRRVIGLQVLTGVLLIINMSCATHQYYNVSRKTPREDVAVLHIASPHINITRINGERLRRREQKRREYVLGPGEYNFTLTYVRGDVVEEPFRRSVVHITRAGPVSLTDTLSGGETYTLAHRMEDRIWKPYIREGRPQQRAPMERVQRGPARPITQMDRQVGEAETERRRKAWAQYDRDLANWRRSHARYVEGRGWVETTKPGPIPQPARPTAPRFPRPE